MFYKEKIDTGSSDESMSLGPTNADTNEAEAPFSSIVNPAYDSGASQATCKTEKKMGPKKLPVRIEPSMTLRRVRIKASRVPNKLKP